MTHIQPPPEPATSSVVDAAVYVGQSVLLLRRAALTAPNCAVLCDLAGRLLAEIPAIEAAARGAL